MRIISVVNHKGGVGKTTSVSALGVALSRMGKRVLLVDIDAQRNLTDTLGTPQTERTIYESLHDLGTLPVVSLSENLDICPSSLDLVSMDIELSTLPDRESRLKKLLQKVSYDFVLIDCPPSLGLLTINALSASDEVIIPLVPEALPTKGLASLLGIVERVQESFNPTLTLGGVVITRYNRRKLNRVIEETLREELGDKVFQTRIRENVDISESPLQGQDIFSYSPNSKGAEDYWSLALEILQK